MTRCREFVSGLPVLLLSFVLINVGNVADAGCSHTIYIMPLYADTTGKLKFRTSKTSNFLVLSEFSNLENYFNECQNKAFEEDMYELVFLSFNCFRILGTLSSACFLCATTKQSLIA
jgi:hypothetical protein